MLFRSLLLRTFSNSKPYVWVNKHTKVICQGMTGNQVPPI